MRCLSCNCQLNDHEATRKYASTGTFIDLCDRCFGYIEDDVPSLDGNPPDQKEEVFDDNPEDNL